MRSPPSGQPCWNARSTTTPTSSSLIPASEDRTFPALMFLAVPEPRQGKNRMHLDLVATDLPAEVERAVALGATKIADFDEYGTRWTTLTDPEGNVFDIGGAHSPGEPAS